MLDLGGEVAAEGEEEGGEEGGEWGEGEGATAEPVGSPCGDKDMADDGRFNGRGDIEQEPHDPIWRVEKAHLAVGEQGGPHEDVGVPEGETAV